MIKYAMDQTASLDRLKSLVSLFSANIAQYKSNQYDEANTRTDFIDKFFTLLDWDVANNNHWNENYRDVIREDKVKIDGSSKAPDYSFRIGGVRKFFVEAKKPAVNIKDASEPAYQVRRYAYTAKLPLSILTDFEEFAIYDTRIKPGKDDKASAARIFYCTFNDYEQNFDFLYNTFSKNAILKGSFDKYIEEHKSKKGTSEVDTELLALVEEWRLELAKNIAKNNPDLSVYNLNTVVQRIIDRIVFLRIAEDRGIEDENLLFSVAKTTNIYEKLILLFIKADTKYNSGLFRQLDWIDKIIIDDKVLYNIIANLYYPECPYEFSVLPIEILGSIYERFLGKTIRFRGIKGDTHTAIIEEKPEVKKAGGVFYTPQYIVDYIVKNTVGEKIKNKTPDEISKINILDPACGSGSFLVGAYQYLLNYHLDYYSQAKNIKTALKTAKIYESGFQSYKLTIEEKQRILTNTIYGVDIDSQAVEVTKLSLYLKLLEDEGKQYKDWLIKYSDIALLPSLEDNIKCGNSLIGSDFYAQPNLDLSDEDRIKVNCFDWEKEFLTILQAGGFDVVIGNPPYVKEQGNKEIFKYVMLSKFKKYHQGKMDFWYYFLHRAMDVIKENGFIGFITNSYWTRSEGASKLIDRIEKELSFNKVVYLDDVKVFEGVSGKHIIHTYQKSKNIKNCLYAEANKINFDKNLNNLEYIAIPSKTLFENGKIVFLANKQISLKNEYLLGDLFDTSIGVQESTDKITQKSLSNKKNQAGFSVGDGVFVLSKKELEMLGLDINESVIIKKYVNTSDVKRYYIDYDNEYLIYTDKNIIDNIGKYPKIKKHLDKVKDFITSSNKPYGLHRPRKEKYFDQPKLICCGMFSTPQFCYDEKKYYFGFSFTSIIRKNNDFSLKYLLGILNSKLAKYWFHVYGKKRGIGVDIGVLVFRKFPLPNIKLDTKTDKTKHDDIVSLVDKILELKQKEAVEQNAQLKTMISRQIEGIDKAIDTAVYALYGLNEDEIKVVEREK